MKLKIFERLDLRLVIIILIILNVILLFFLLSRRMERSLSQRSLISVSNFPEIKEIKGKNLDFQQSAKFFRDLSVEQGGEYGYKALALAANLGYVTPNVDTHLLGHVVGDVLYKQKGIEGIKACTDDLRNACSHSIVVGFLIENGEESLPLAVSTCEGAPGGLGAYTMCIHGLGHGVLGYTEYDMKKAVALCNQTGTSKYNFQEIGQCVGGVTMEMMAGVHDKEAWAKQKTNYFKDSDPLAPCSLGFISKEALGFCYMYLTPHLFEVAGASMANPEPKYFGKAMSYCLAIPKSLKVRDVCLGSFGKEYVVLANTRNIQSVNKMNDNQLKLVDDWCGLGGPEAVLPCLDSALQSLYWGGENDPDVSIRFCNVLKDKDNQNYCVRQLISAVGFYMKNNQTAKENFCQKVKSEYVLECQERILTKKDEI